LPGWTPSARDAYNWLTDTYIAYDGSRWVNTAPDYVAYSMDPRNFLSDTQVFQHLQLSYDPATQTIETVQSMLTGTFMETALIKNLEGVDVSYAQTVMDASNAYHVNPYFLVARIKQEILLGDGQPCGTASGVYPGYEGYYNFYNIGAISSPDPVGPGLIYAQGGASEPKATTFLRPWNSQYKAILGGAMWIENGYIARGQDTLYFQRFDVIDNEDGLYWHQYMTSTQAPVSEAIRLKAAYENLTDLPLAFKIPVYLNMPEQRVVPPLPRGNPNNWLTSITVDGHVLTPSFDPNILQYDLIVGSAVESVTISATTVTSLAKIAGTGAQPLVVGSNPIKLTVTAQNQDIREYTLNITRLDPSVEPQFTTTYILKDQNISGIDEGTTVEAFLQQFAMVEGMTAKVYDATGNEIVPDGVRTMRTGDQLRVLGAENVVVNIYPIVLFGDANGDGMISASDLTLISRNIISELQGNQPLIDGIKALAANANHDTMISASDLTLISKHILDVEKKTIDQRGTT
jgi:beta-N-acetylglucosaminidase